MRISDLNPEDLKKAMDNTIKHKSIKYWNDSVDKDMFVEDMFLFHTSNEGFSYWANLLDDFYGK